MLADMHTPLEPPSAPFANRADSFRSLSPKNDSPLSAADKHLSTSLSINYLPTKFSNSLVTKRKRNGKGYDSMVPKQGGGREAFKSNEARMPGEGDDDYDGVDAGLFGGKEGGRTRPRGHWNRFKWALFVANSIVRRSLCFIASPTARCRRLASQSCVWSSVVSLLWEQARHHFGRLGGRTPNVGFSEYR